MNISQILLAGWMIICLTSVAACSSVPQALAHQDPMLPQPLREFVDTELPPASGRTIHVPAGGDLQDALDVARLGDTIVLESGATFKGPFSLPNKTSGAGWITIRSSGVDRQFPPPGTRVGPGQAAMMATLSSWREAVVTAERGAHHYRFIGVEIRPEEGRYLNTLLWFGSNREPSIDQLPHHIIIDRCYVHGDPRKGARRGSALNGRHLAVIDSYFSDFKEAGGDSQALMGWGGPGPFKIVNNYLEGAGENLMFGGADPFIRDLVPSDIEVRRNYMTKPLAWKRGEPGYDGSKWSVKNLFELKNARRVLVDGNVMEHSWEESQSGFAVLLTVRNQDGRAPWSVVEDVQFTNNVIRHSGSGITMMGHDNNRAPDQSRETARILIKNNVWEDIGGERWGGRGILFQLVEGTSDVVIENNSGAQTGSLVYIEGPPHKRFAFRKNKGPHNEYGITGRGAGVGLRAMEVYCPDGVVAENVIAGGDPRQYPETNAFPASLDEGPPEEPSRAERVTGSMTAGHRAEQQGAGARARGADIATLCAALGAAAQTERVCKHTRYAEAGR